MLKRKKLKNCHIRLWNEVIGIFELFATDWDNNIFSIGLITISNWQNLNGNQLNRKVKKWLRILGYKITKRRNKK